MPISEQPQHRTRRRAAVARAARPKQVTRPPSGGASIIEFRGVSKLYAGDIQKGVPPDAVDKLRKMLAFLDDMEEAEELRALPSWKVHTLTGDRKGTWSLSVTANRRLTFRIDTGEREIYDANLEDYH